MKFFLAFLLISFVYSNSSAQFILTPKKPIKINAESIDKYEGSQLKDSIPFSAIKIIDSRYDTTSIGFYLDGFLTLKDSSQPVALQHIIDKYYHNLWA